MNPNVTTTMIMLRWRKFDVTAINQRQYRYVTCSITYCLKTDIDAKPRAIYRGITEDTKFLSSQIQSLLTEWLKAKSSAPELPRRYANH